jgi:hypothetical protein
MRPFLLIPYYIRWHYLTAFHGILRITENIVWFTWHFFSIGLNTMTLFARHSNGLKKKRRKGFDLEAYLSTFTVNIIMRIVGALVRGVFIIVGLVAIAVEIVMSWFIFIVWLVLPFASLFVLFTGIVFITKS